MLSPQMTFYSIMCRTGVEAVDLVLREIERQGGQPPDRDRVLIQVWKAFNDFMPNETPSYKDITLCQQLGIDIPRQHGNSEVQLLVKESQFLGKLCDLIIDDKDELPNKSSTPLRLIMMVKGPQVGNLGIERLTNLGAETVLATYHLVEEMIHEMVKV